MSANGLVLGEEADFGAQNCLLALNLIRSTKLHLSTEPLFCQTPVSGSGFLSYAIVNKFCFVKNINLIVRSANLFAPTSFKVFGKYAT
jgi:hypothetical protein